MKNTMTKASERRLTNAAKRAQRTLDRLLADMNAALDESPDAREIVIGAALVLRDTLIKASSRAGGASSASYFEDCRIRDAEIKRATPITELMDAADDETLRRMNGG